MIDYLLFSAAALYGLYVFYCAVMNIKRVREMGKLTRVGMALGLPTLAIAATLDALCNIFVMSVLLAELPREWLVTTRLQRHHKESTGWRLAVVKFFEPVLDPLDPDGDHI
jgi:hypothetical protein